MRKRVNFSEDTATEPQQAPVEPFAQRLTDERSTSTAWLGIKLVDGKPDWDRMREAKRERWQAFMHDPDTLRRFNLSPASADEPVILVDPQFVHSALDFLGEFQAQIIAHKYKLTIEEARSIALYSQVEKEIITPPAQRVLSKRCPDFIVKYGDEIILAVTLANIARLKFALAARVRNEKQNPPSETGNGQEEVVAVQ